MLDSSADRDPLDRLAEEFVARYRAGDRPPLSEYAARLPDRADEVLELFPALVELEQLKPGTADTDSVYTPSAIPSDPTRVGEFRILRRVGLGGMGAVYEAIQESLGRHVALKLLPLEAVADPKRLERFRREAKAAAKLHHTNIVPVFGTGEADGRHFYAMQFISGHPLDAVIDEVRRLKDHDAASSPKAVSQVANALVTGAFSKPPSPLIDKGAEVTRTHAADDPAGATLPYVTTPPSSHSGTVSSPSLSDGGRAYWGTVARLGSQVADALVYAHAQGVLHRDIKPSNLLLDLQGTVWVADFGLAKSNDVDDLTQAGDVIGTLRYMAPERFEGGGDHRADVYALGLTLYELLCLRPAFEANTRAKLIEMALAADPPRPRAINPGIPRDLETIVLKAIQRDPLARYQSAAELAEDLRRFVEDRPIRARRVTATEQTVRWCRRNPAVALLMTAVLTVTTLGTVVASAFAVRADAEREKALNREREAVAARKSAAEARSAAEQLTAEKQRQLLRLHLATARSHGVSGDRQGALLWTARAWREDSSGVYPEVNHRVRLGANLNAHIPLAGLAAHNAPLADARIDSDGRVAITLTKPGQAFLWDIRKGRTSGPLPHPGSVTSVALSTDGKWAVTGSSDGTARVWDSATGVLVHTLAVAERVEWVDVDADGSRVAVAAGRAGVTVWQRNSATQPPQPDVPGAHYVGFSADGTKLATADLGGSARVWDTATGKPLTPRYPFSPRDPIERNWHYRLGPVFSPDGTRLLTRSFNEGKQYKGGSPGVMTLWDVATGKAVWGPIQGGEHFARFDPSGKMLLTGVIPCSLIDVATGKQLARFSTPRHCQGAEFLPNDRVAVISTGGQIQIHSRPTAASPTPPILQEDLSLSARGVDTFITTSTAGGGRYLFAAGWDGTARLYDLNPPYYPKYAFDCGNANEIVQIIDDEQRQYSADGVWECRLNRAGTVRVGRRADFTNPIQLKSPEPVTGATFARSGHLLFTVTATTVRAWNPSDGTPAGPPVEHGIKGNIRISSGGAGRLMVSSQNPTSSQSAEVVVLDLLTGERLLTCRYEPHQLSFSSNRPALSEDGRRLVTGDFAFSGSVEVWDVDARRRLSRLDASRGHLQHLEFSSDGRRVLVSSSDGTCRLWDVETSQPAGPPMSRLPGAGKFIGPDGRTVVTDSNQGTGLLIQDGLTGEVLATGAGRSNRLWFAQSGDRIVRMTLSTKDIVCLYLNPTKLPVDHVDPLCDLITGMRLDPATDGIEFLPADAITGAHERYLSAFRAWRAELDERASKLK